MWGGTIDDDSSPKVGSSDKNSYINSSATTKEKHAKAQLGVLANATVKIYGLGNKTRKLLFTETTTSGSTIEEIGNFNAHENELLNDVYYLYEVKGGEDWDADDDGVVNQSPMENRGTFRAVIKGSVIKSLGGNITISAVSEILYTKVSDSIRTPNILDEKIEKASKEIIKNDLNSDGIVDSSDIVHYNPIHDEDKLKIAYKDKIKSVIFDIHNGDAIDISLKPILKSAIFTVDKQISLNMVIGKVELLNDVQARTAFYFSKTYHIPFAINENNEIYIANSEYLTAKTYKLKVYAENKAGKSDEVDVTIIVKNSADTQPPVIIIDSFIEFEEGTIMGGTMKYFEVKDETMVKLELEGEDKDVFHIFERDGEKWLIMHGSDFENPRDKNKDNIYKVTIKATDGAGNVSRKPVTLTVLNKIDEKPVLRDTFVEFVKRDDIYSDLDNGDIYLGKVMVDYEGDTPIESFEISGLPSISYSLSKEIVRIDDDGKIFLNSNENFLGGSYTANKTRSGFLRQFTTEGEMVSIGVKAKNKRGNSKQAELKVIITTDGDFDVHPHIASYDKLGYASSRSFLQNGKIFTSEGLYDINDSNRVVSIDSNITDYKNIKEMVLSMDENIAYVRYKLEEEKLTKYAIEILDMHDLKHIKSIKKIITDDSVERFALSSDEHYLYVKYHDTLKVYDVIKPSNPSLIMTYAIDRYDGSKIKLSKDGNLCYLYTSEKIEILDTSNPKNIIKVNTLSVKVNDIDIASDGTKLYVISDKALSIFDISNPSSENKESYISVPSTGFKYIKISPDGTKAYIAGYSTGVRIIDITDTKSPKTIGFIRGFDSIRDIMVSADGNYLYIIGTHGFYAIDVREDSEKED